MWNFKYLRPCKAKQLQNWYHEQIAEINDLSVRVYDDATILPLKTDSCSGLAWGRGGLLDAHGSYVKESSILGYYDNGYNCGASVKNSSETVMYCGYFRRHWGDFLVDCTNRLWAALNKEWADKIDKFIYFVDAEGSTKVDGVYREFFELLGIWDRVEFINHPVKYKTVVMPDSCFCRQERKWNVEQYLRIFDRVAERALQAMDSPNMKLTESEKIFLTRSGLAKAKQIEIGLEMLDSFFHENGYSVISPETLSLKEQIIYLRNAKTVACCSGTLPHNMLFANQGQRLEIIERNALNNGAQPYISRMKELEVYHIDGNLTIYPVELAYGPLIYAYSKPMQSFVSDMGYLAPDECYSSKKYLRKLFREYIKKYKNEHYISWYMGGAFPWMERDIDILYEAYQESEEIFGDYMKGKKIFQMSQIFEQRFIRIGIKRVLFQKK